MEQNQQDQQGQLTDEYAEIATRTLTALAGPDAQLREDQQRAVTALVRDGARVLVVQATGWGKSAVYWVATAIRRHSSAQGGMTLVVSPLLSLMRDQVAAAERAGLTARTLNSANFDDWSAIESELAADEIDVLLVSPERLANPKFGARVMEQLAGRIGLLVIDEAHSISDWGHDFRPDYRRISAVMQQLNPDAAVLATTATANQRVTDDVAAQLGADALVLRGPLARSSLQLVVTPDTDPLSRFAWVCDQIDQLPGSGIVYTLTVSDAEQLTAAIKAVRGDDYPVAAYTGQLEADTRTALEDCLRRNEIKALVATSALGMGFDKPDLGFVVHIGAPPSPVSYYQQVGRAGRGIDNAVVVLLPSHADRHVWDYFATATIPVPEQVERVLDALREAGEPQSVIKLEAATGVRRTRVELILKQLAVDGVTERVDGGWVATGADWHYDKEHYESVVATRKREAAIMQDYAAGARCLMQLLQESLDDPSAAPCGRCSVCDPSSAASYVAPPPTEVREQVAAMLRRQVHALEPRKMWPGPPSERRGRISGEQSAGWGRVLVEYDAPQWQDPAAEMDSDGPASEQLQQAVVTLLAAWARGTSRDSPWPQRPDVVVDLAAGGLQALTSSLSDFVAQTGKLQRASFDSEALQLGARRAASEDLTSPSSAALWDGSLVAPSGLDGAVVLLVIDRDPSSWAATVGAAKLREAGASIVLPLLLRRAAS